MLSFVNITFKTLYFIDVYSTIKVVIEMEREIMGSLEIEIMNAIWTILEMNDNANIAITDVVNFLADTGVERAYTTIKTVMDRLVSKGILARFKSGKKFFYVATINRFEATMMSVEKVANQFFDGNFDNMMQFMEQNCKTVVMA